MAIMGLTDHLRPAALILTLVACRNASHTTVAATHFDTSEPRAGAEVSTRGARIETAPDVGPGEPFIVEATLHGRRRENGVWVSLGQLRNEDSVASGDRLQLSIQTTTSAHLYIAFCAEQTADARRPELTMFPPRGSIRLEANKLEIAPSEASEIVIDEVPGREALYAILSKVDLSMAHPHIAAAIAAARRGVSTADCGDPLHLTSKATAGVGRRPRKITGNPAAPISGNNTGARISPSPQSADALVVSTETGEPLLDPTRGGEVVLTSGSFGDATGLVVLRYGLRHVARPQRSRPLASEGGQ